MQEVFSKIIEKLEEELKLADKEKERCIKENHLQFDYAKGYSNGVANAIEIVKREAEKYNNGWIPCSERLPEESLQSVMGWDEYRERICFVHFIRGRFILGDDTDSVNIIAWQPLPAPYQPTRESCSNRHENGNCLAVGGFCTSVDDKYCKYHKKKTNFDMCCESMEAMAQIIDIAKIGWTKEQIMEWLQKEECEVPE